MKPDDEVTVESTAPDAAVADSQPVPLVSGRYTNKKSHAPGGMGHVFIAHDRSLNRTIAIKELRAKVGPVGRTSLPDSRAVRFLREAQITAKLEHPAVTPVHELGVRDDGTLYYTMKLVEGATLSESIFKGQTREERLQYLPNLVSVANAAAYAHSKGVIHRDIKPDNIVLGDYGETVLVDWGVAKIDDEDTLWMDTETYTPADNETDAALTLPGSVIGTPAYMPPEQALGKNRELDERADVYSLGAVLYSILTGERPFSGDSATEILERVGRELPVPIQKHEPKAPKELVSICEKAMSFNRNDRFDSVRALTDELNRYQDARDVHCYPYSFQEKAIRVVARHRMIASILLSASILLGVISGGYSIQLRMINIDLEEARQSEAAERIAAEAIAEQLRHENYSVSIRIAQKQIEEKRFDAAERTLLSCPVDLRRWEWGYLYQQC
ncbi:MAG: serine/threonine-protein kinase, partial [Candidatus Hydrogenedentota bacterium]